MMGGKANGMLMQLVAVGIGVFFLATYWQTGRQAMRSIFSSMEIMHLREIASHLDTHAASLAAEEDTSTQGVFPFPTTYDDFCQTVEKAAPAKGKRAWHDRWQTALWYRSYLYQEIAGYDLASAGVDTKWKTEDDLWVGRYGDKSYSWQAEKKKKKKPGKDEPASTAGNQ